MLKISFVELCTTHSMSVWSSMIKNSQNETYHHALLEEESEQLALVSKQLALVLKQLVLVSRQLALVSKQSGLVSKQSGLVSKRLVLE